MSDSDKHIKRNWRTREETAIIIKLSTRSVDRLVTYGRLITLPKLPGNAGTRIKLTSIEEYLGHKVTDDVPSVRPVITIDQDHYEAMRSQITRKDIQLREMSQKLLQWEGEKELLAQTVEEAQLLKEQLKALEQERAAAEAKAESLKNRGFWARLLNKTED